MQRLANNPEIAESILDGLSDCIRRGVEGVIERANEEVAFQAEIRTKMADSWENCTCADDKTNATEPKRETTWRGKSVGIMVDRPASKIHTIENFISPEECDAAREAAVPDPHDAQVADGSGGSEASESRKAKQSGIEVDWELEGEGDPIARLSRRVHDYVNHVLALGISEDEQEDLVYIQYFGRGPGDHAPDRYVPHCDGDCAGMPFKQGNPVATVVMYCDVPERGGGTNFRNSGVHIRPKRHAATFFSYIDPDNMVMDGGFTEHSGCPVVEGTKRILMQWVRLGVDEENPWDSFNTMGIKHSDAANQ